MSTANGTYVLPRMSTDAPEGCVDCAARVASHLGSLPGVIEIDVSPNPARLTYSYDAQLLTPLEIEQAAEAMLVELDQRYVHEVLAIEGMDCADCARKVEQGVGRMAGVESAAVNLIAARLAVEYDRTQVDAGRIARRVHDLGYEVSAESTQQQPRSTSLPGFLLRRANWPSLAAAVLTVIGIALTAAGASAPLAVAPLLAAVVVGGLPLARKGLMNLIHNRSLDINALMTIAVIGAALIGEWVEASVVVVLFAVSEALEGYAMDRARQTIRNLMSLTPPTALVQQPGGEVEMPVEQVRPGDVVIVRPGQRVPLDGVVTHGASSVDQASLTGESLPVSKEQGDALYAGTLNGAGPLTMLVTRAAGDSSMAKIIHLVEQAQAQRAPVQRFIDRFARIYTPAVLALAVVMTVVPTLLGAPFTEWFYRALVLLVIACPCALVLSTPVAIVSALAAAARGGILIKGGAYLERAAAIDTIAFDKTGTLTMGRPEVTAVIPLNGASADELLATAASIERHSEHALGQAIVRAAHERDMPLGQAAGVLSVTGAGLTATYAGAEYRIGSRRLFDGTALSAGATAAIDEIERGGGTAVLLGRDAEIEGVIGLLDVPRPETRAALAELHQAGVTRLVMLSGDRMAAAEQIAGQLGLDEVRAELLPEHKLDAIAELKQSGGVVAMVGDGVNDAPALAAADLGIAMGVAGTDAALETADIALMGDDLRGLARVIALGKRAKRVIAANIAVSLGVKALFLALALGGFATLWMAIFADVGTALIVIANSLRLFRGRG